MCVLRASPSAPKAALTLGGQQVPEAAVTEAHRAGP